MYLVYTLSKVHVYYIFIHQAFGVRYGMEGHYHPESTVRYKASAGQHTVSLVHQVD
ncbi:hypothetical protein qdsa002_44 [Staphylococcus phage qdsa002]|uniref:Uncharacterized protein n=1 Tax=Staphylococcus phage qdsa002 TaxID=1970746 RepID=A0A1X9SIV3_9CAUD|nr:hypothetical protein qdsa002_44 [Staphylococcus phage qdsa002]